MPSRPVKRFLPWSQFSVLCIILNLSPVSIGICFSPLARKGYLAMARPSVFSQIDILHFLIKRLFPLKKYLFLFCKHNSLTKELFKTHPLCNYMKLFLYTCIVCITEIVFKVFKKEFSDVLMKLNAFLINKSTESMKVLSMMNAFSFYVHKKENYTLSIM